MKGYVKSIDGLSKILKFLLAFFLNPIIFGLYRAGKRNWLIGILWFITAGFFGIGWIIDLITIATQNKVTLLA